MVRLTDEASTRFLAGKGTMSSSDQEANRWIRHFHRCADDALQLVCFPHAGGSASYYHMLSRELAPEIEVLAVQYPGRQDRRSEPLVDDLLELSERVFHVLGGVTARPFALFGHSMGATVAYEVAQRLRDQAGPEPLWLFVSGRRAPSRKRPAKMHDPRSLLAELQKLGGTDPRLLADRELLATFLPAALNDYNAVQAYSWAAAPPLSCPVTALVGDTDPQSTTEETLAWAEHTTGSFQATFFSGGHFYLDTHWADVVAAISAALGKAPKVDSLDRSAW